MAEYIEREKIYKLIGRKYGWSGNQIAVEDIIQDVRNLPAADVRPKWCGR